MAFESYGEAQRRLMSRWSDGRESHPHCESGALGSCYWTTVASSWFHLPRIEFLTEKAVDWHSSFARVEGKLTARGVELSTANVRKLTLRLRPDTFPGTRAVPIFVNGSPAGSVEVPKDATGAIAISVDVERRTVKVRSVASVIVR